VIIPENNKGMVGPGTATASAKRLTINPAFHFEPIPLIVAKKAHELQRHYH
jgi:hypothetical protein